MASTLASSLRQGSLQLRSRFAITQGIRWSSSDAAASATNAAVIGETSASGSTSSNTQNATNTTHYRVTLRRSAIGLPHTTRRVVEALGLRKRLASVYLVKHARNAGAILAVKELVHVENVRMLDVTSGQASLSSEGPEQLSGVTTEENRSGHQPPAIWVNERGEVVDWGGKQARKAPRGYTVIGNVVNQARHEQIQAGKNDRDV